MSRLIVIVEAAPNVDAEGNLQYGHTSTVSARWVTDAGEPLMGTIPAAEVISVLDAAKNGLLARIVLNAPPLVTAAGVIPRPS